MIVGPPWSLTLENREHDFVHAPFFGHEHACAHESLPHASSLRVWINLHFVASDSKSVGQDTTRRSESAFRG